MLLACLRSSLSALVLNLPSRPLEALLFVIEMQFKGQTGSFVGIVGSIDPQEWNFPLKVDNVIVIRSCSDGPIYASPRPSIGRP